MGSYRETTIAGKAAQRGIVEQKPLGGRNKRDRPWVVESSWQSFDRDSWGAWARHGSYRTKAEADAVIAQQERKYSWMKLRLKAPTPSMDGNI